MALWFDRPGKENTADVIECVLQHLRERSIQHVVVATNSGATGLRLAVELDEEPVEVICVSHHAGFRSDDQLDLEPEYASELRERKIPVLIAGHSLSGVGRSISARFGGATQVEIIAHTLRLFGQGMKVCVEIAVMAADAGLIPTHTDVVAIGGTGRGADTAVVLQPAHMSTFFDLRIREVLCKPRGV